MGIIFIVLFIGALFFPYFVFDRKLKLKKYESIFLSISIVIYVNRIISSILDAISGDYTTLAITLIVFTCTSIMSIRAYLKKKDIIIGYFNGILLALPLTLVYSIITI